MKTTTVTRFSATGRRGAVTGLALLLSLPAAADELRQAIRKELRDVSYVLVEAPSYVRLYLLSAPDADAEPAMQPLQAGETDALAKTESSEARERLLGLTALAGDVSTAALNAALALLSDPVVAVREEAVQLAMEHPGADHGSILAIALSDPSHRVRDAAQDLLDDEAFE